MQITRSVLRWENRELRCHYGTNFPKGEQPLSALDLSPPTGSESLTLPSPELQASSGEVEGRGGSGLLEEVAWQSPGSDILSQCVSGYSAGHRPECGAVQGKLALT